MSSSILCGMIKGCGSITSGNAKKAPINATIKIKSEAKVHENKPLDNSFLLHESIGVASLRAIVFLRDPIGDKISSTCSPSFKRIPFSIPAHPGIVPVPIISPG
jgi:hypothetical protein